MRDGNSKKSKVYEMPSLLFNLYAIFFFQFILEGTESVNSVYLVKLSWPKTLVKKWFNIKSKAEDFHADDVVDGGLTLIMAYHFLSISA